jgi:hypothetical protein
MDGRRGPLWLLLGSILPVHTPVSKITRTTSALGLTGRATGVMPVFSHVRRKHAISFAVIKPHQGLTSCDFLLLPDNVLLCFFQGDPDITIAKTPIVPMWKYWSIPELK